MIKLTKLKFKVPVLRSMKIGTKLAIGSFVLISSVFVLLVGAITYFSAREIEQNAINDVTDKTEIIMKFIAERDSELRQEVDVLARGFNDALGEEYQLTVGDESTMDVGGTKVPRMIRSNYVVNNDHEEAEKFAQATGAFGAILVKTDKDYAFISTSLKDENKNPRVGMGISELRQEARDGIMQGKGYQGLVTLFGKQYVAKFSPIVDNKKNVIGMTAVGVDFNEALAGIKEIVRRQKIGKTGYYFILDSNPGKNFGHMIVHRDYEGQSRLEVKDANGVEYIKNMIAKKNGMYFYPFFDKSGGTTRVRDKIAVHRSFDDWGWIVAGGTYMDEFSESVIKLRNIFAGIAAGMVLFISLVLYFSVRTTVSKPLAKASSVAEAMAGGDLTARMDSNRGDEIGMLAKSINNIGSGISGLVRKVRDGSESVASASSQIMQSNTDLSQRTETQASALVETAASAEQLGATARNNAASAKQADELSKDASAVASSGGEVVSQVVERMESISGSSKKMSEIAKIIENIAFQTNILALNAAVEAARAGDQGKGFAVVASEVRNLAGRSAQAAKEIGALINSSVDEIQQGGVLASQAGKTMQEVVESIHRVTDIMSEISTASAEQESGVTQVSAAVSQMDSATQQNSALVEEMATAAANLENQAQDLVKAVSAFKV